jgi:tryptophanyl-tRNA synthetase
LLEPDEPKNPDDSTVFQIWQAFATADQIQYMRDQFAAGIAWGESKKQLFELINTELTDARARYERLMASPAEIEQALLVGAKKAREKAAVTMAQVRKAVGISALA